MAARWAVESGVLGIQRNDTFVVPTAMEILDSIVERQPPWDDLEPGPSGDASPLRFSTYPLALKLELIKAGDGLPIELILTGSAAAYRLRLKTIPINDHIIDDGIWHPIDQDSFTSVRALVASLGLVLGPLRSLKLFLELRRRSQAEDTIVDRTDDEIHGLADFSLSATDDAPKNVSASLYPYQLDGWRWLRFVVNEGLGGILADEMGLGKTLQIISMLADPGTAQPLPALIIAPGSLLENWCREFRKFSPNLSVLKHHGSTRTGRPAILKDYHIVVTSYDTIVRDGGLFNMIDWSTVILDEAQNIKNPDAARTRAVKSLRRHSGFAVTGTPLENRISDLWSISDFAMPGYLGNLASFQKIYSDTPQSAAELENFVSPIMLRRRVSSVAKDLPERIDIPQVIELDTREADSYERIRTSIFDKFGAAATLVSLTSLRMFCAHPSLVDKTLPRDMPFSKVIRLYEIIDEIFAAKEKVIVFTSYTEMADLIRDGIEQTYKVFSRTLDGRTPIPDRQSLIDEFAKVIGPALLVLNPKAGGSGLNITAANHVIHYNLEWNPALEDQASARAYRRGQSLPVTVHRLFLANTVEEIVDDRVARKRRLSEMAIVGISGKEADYADIVAALQLSPVRLKDKGTS